MTALFGSLLFIINLREMKKYSLIFLNSDRDTLELMS